MRWRKRDLWRAAVVFGSVLLLLVLMTLVTIPTTDAYESVSGAATLATAQATPTVDATEAALQKEQLAQQVAQGQYTWENWLWSNAAAISSALVIGLAALFGLGRWFGDRRVERERRAEERFQSVIEGLGDDNEGRKVGAAIMLRTFLRPGYKQFYSQAFDLAVAYLRLRHVDPNTPEPLDSLTQALAIVFKEAFPLARDLLKQDPLNHSAIRVQLDGAYLARSDLRQMHLPEAYLRRANFFVTDFTDANLREAKFYKSDLTQADFTKANLKRADLREAILTFANLTEANLSGADLSGVCNLEKARSLKNTDLRGVTGLTKEQLLACEAKGAIVNEETLAKATQVTASLSASSQSNNTQSPASASAQVKTPPANTKVSNGASSQPSEVPKKE